MPTPPLPDELRALLRKPNPAVVATLRPDGQPVTVATWYLLEEDGEHAGRVLLNMEDSRVRVGHLRQDPRVALTALDEASWYTHVSLIGRIVAWDDGREPALADIDRLSRHYGGRDYPVRDKPRVSAWMEIERYHGWGAARS